MSTLLQQQAQIEKVAESTDAGLNRADFGKLLQQYATELSIAKDSVRTDDEKKALLLYGEALDIWKDSATLWDAKLSMPARKREAESYRDTFAVPSGDLKTIDLCLDFSLLLINSKLPIQNFPDKQEGIEAVLAKRYNLPVKEEKGWKWIDPDSFKDLWLLAGEKASAADNLVRSRGT